MMFLFAVLMLMVACEPRVEGVSFHVNRPGRFSLLRIFNHVAQHSRTLFMTPTMALIDASFSFLFKHIFLFLLSRRMSINHV